MENDTIQDVNEVVTLSEGQEVNAYLGIQGWKLLKIYTNRDASGSEYPRYILGWTDRLPGYHTSI